MSGTAPMWVVVMLTGFICAEFVLMAWMLRQWKSALDGWKQAVRDLEGGDR